MSEFEVIVISVAITLMVIAGIVIHMAVQSKSREDATHQEDSYLFTL